MKLPYWRKCLTLVALLSAFYTGYDQTQPIHYSVANAHAHNDYEHNIPFVQANALGFGSIEADVILFNDSLFVAHDQKDIHTRPLFFERDYIQPLYAAIQAQGDTGRRLVLLIDLKTEAVSTLNKVISIIEKYPVLTKAAGLQFVITGNQPPPATFGQYPEYIFFDGNINDPGHIQQVNRIGMFSDNFRKYSNWNGKGHIPGDERKALTGVIQKVHALHKKIRFWGCPDNINTWYAFMDLQVDYLNTDHIEKLADFLNNLPSTSSFPANQYQLYQPQYKVDGIIKPVRNVILMIGDGTGLAQWYAGYTGNQGKLNVFNMHSVGL
ncbi:MAG TPA: alkaline phosphatase, partial [Agriterribacter sp.]|nr:alkaline phosphatase [Agriterribacter sp.]